MKKYIVWSLLICIAGLCGSCVEEIDANLLADQPKVVVNGLITDQPGPYYVRLHYSRGALTLPPRKNAGQPSIPQLDKFEAINDALVILTDNLGNTDTLELWQPGIKPDNDTSQVYEWNDRGVYRTKNFPQAQAGINYQLRVIHQGNTYTATATMPHPAPSIDQVTFTLNEANAIRFVPEGVHYFPMLSFNEPQNQKNYYRFFAKVQEFIDTSNDGSLSVGGGGTWLNGPDNFWPIIDFNYFIINDQLLKPQVKGLQINTKWNLFTRGPWTFSFKEINVQMHSITQEAYEFFSALQEQQQNNETKIFSTAPASPPTNIQGGALGFFTVAAVSKRRVLHPDS